MRAAVNNGGTAVLTQVLTGTGGVGKTQVAADYARTAWENGEVDVLVWISASSRASIMNGYAQAGIEVLAADPSAPEQAMRAFLAWLEPKAGEKTCHWLVVLDDVADPADMRGLWPPASRHGRALVTTRRREAALTGANRRRVTVGLFTPQEASAYFTAVLAANDRYEEPTGEITSLAADLGYLPLALAQAAAYIIDATLSCASYRQLLIDRMRKLADLLPEPGALPDDQPATVAATWSLSIERADKLRPVGLTRPVLQMAAMLAPDGIPQTVFASSAMRAHLAGRVGGPEPVPVDDAVSALRALHRLSLIDHVPDTPGHAVRIHQLVQRAVRDTLSPSQRESLAVIAAHALEESWPPGSFGRAAAQTLVSNTAVLTSHAPNAVWQAEDALWRSDGHPLLLRRADRNDESAGRLGERAGRLIERAERLGELGLFAEAARRYQRLAVAARLRFGPVHYRALKARSRHAHWQGEAGDPAGAIATLGELLADQERIHPGHMHVRTTRSHLAHWRGRAGDPAGAAATLAEVLDAHTRGPLRTLTYGAINENFTLRRRVSSWKGAAGDPAGAVAEFTELLAHIERTFRNTPTINPRMYRPNQVAARIHRAHWRGVAGDSVGAVTELTQILTERGRSLGHGHPQSQVTLKHLTHWQQAVDDPTTAASSAELLTDLEQTLPG